MEAEVDPKATNSTGNNIGETERPVEPEILEKDRNAVLLEVRQLSQEVRDEVKEKQMKFTQRQVHMYETLIADRDSNMSSLEEKLTEVTAANEVYNREIALLQESMVALQDKVEELKSYDENNVALLLERDTVIETLTGKASNLSHELALKADHINELEMHDKEMRNQLSESNFETTTKLSQIKTELNFMHDENDRLELRINDKNQEMEKLQVDYENKCIALKNTEIAHTTLQNIISDKDDIIKSQKAIIAGCQIQPNCDNVTTSELDNMKSLLSVKNEEIEEFKKQISDLEIIRICDCDELRKSLVNERTQSESLSKTIKDKDLIIEKMGLAYDVQNELVNTKDDLIQNLKMLVEQNKNSRSRIQQEDFSSSVSKQQTNLTSDNSLTVNSTEIERDVSSDVDGDPEKNKIPGLDETVLRLKGFSLHGVILDGLLTWIDTKRRTIPENMWKQQVIMHFTPEEITNAKNALWEVADDDLLDRNIIRKGVLKSTSEVNDICGALKTLSEKQMMPVFIGTSTMVMQSPQTVEESNQQNQCEINIKLDSLMLSFEDFSKNHTELLSKNHDRVISKIDVGHKKLNDFTGKFKHPENDGQHESEKIPSLYPNLETTFGSLQTNCKIPLDNEVPWKKVVRYDSNKKSPIKTISPVKIPELAPYRSIVVKGLGLDITREKLIGHLLSKGITTLDCYVITTYENAQSLAYKITVNTFDENKVKDIAMWPEYVTVQPFKQKRRKSFSNDMTGSNLKRSVVKNPRGLSVRFENEDAQDVLYNHSSSGYN